MRGTVKFFNNERGYGFITGDDGHEAFAHFSSIISEHRYKTLTEGDLVEYDVERVEKGFNAKSIRQIAG